MGLFEPNFKTNYSLKAQGNGVYAFLLSGKMRVNDIELEARDGLGLWDIDSLTIESLDAASEILLMEVPMKL
jgi:redox-sensitive bicupin YhaK (pirin superfamily)